VGYKSDRFHTVSGFVRWQSALRDRFQLAFWLSANLTSWSSSDRLCVGQRFRCEFKSADL
jgi:hypothetical protein